MEIQRMSIPDLVLITPRIFGDDRGFFFESYNQRFFSQSTGLTIDFVQDNHSKSQRGVLRGLHYQLPPHAQGKLVRVIRGKVFDVAVDIRASSSTFGTWAGVELSAENKKQLWIPPGFAHGFLTLSEEAEVLYKATNFYAPEFEGHIIWNDPNIDIEWPLDVQPILSQKDQLEHTLKTATLFE